MEFGITRLGTLAVYKEALRLYPPAYMLVRRATNDTRLGKLKVKRGDQVVIGLRQMHRNPKYFEAPDEFRPSRFMPTSPKPPSFSFLPFGAGPKSCVGEPLAYREALLVLKAMCEAFAFSRDERSIGEVPLITLRPGKGQKLTLRRRVHKEALLGVH